MMKVSSRMKTLGLAKHGDAHWRCSPGTPSSSKVRSFFDLAFLATGLISHGFFFRRSNHRRLISS